MSIFRTLALAAACIVAGGAAARAQARGLPGGGRTTGSAMTEHGGKLYVVTGSVLARLDAKTLKVEAKADLSRVGKTKEEEEAEERRRKEFMEQHDANNDGEVTQEELGRRRYLIFRYDGNGDRKLTIEELKAMGATAPGASGDPELVVKDGKLFMLRGGMVFAFSLKTLELEDSAAVVERPKPQPPATRPAAAPQRPPAGPRPEAKADDAGAF